VGAQQHDRRDAEAAEVLDARRVSRTGQEDRYMPLPKRPVGDELAEELRRLDADQIYGEALGAMAGIPDLDERPPMRVHVWKDPALAARAAS
jgi:glucose-6-phosphate dehydrogenase assembly protein OpcA